MGSFKFKFIEDNFNSIYNDLYNFCKIAEKETKINKTQLNMKAQNWKNYPQSLLYRIYKSKKYDNGNGATCLLYDNDGICAFSGIEKHTDNIAVMAKRFYVKYKYRSNPILSTYMINPQITWATKKNFKICLITVNEYQRNTVLEIIKRIKNKQAVVLGKKINTSFLYDKIKIFSCKVFINNEYQYIICYKIKKDYKFSLKEI